MAAAVHTDDAWKRLTRTIDLTGVSAADKPTLRSELLWDTEPGYDHAVVEIHTAGADDWTTLPEKGGATSTAVPTECEAGFLIAEHPCPQALPDPRSSGCTATGTTGSWNSFTGASDGWQQVGFDLSAYAGKSVEVSLSYITDPGSGGHGVLADDTSLVVGGTATQAEGFETSLGAWSVPGACHIGADRAAHQRRCRFGRIGTSRASNFYGPPCRVWGISMSPGGLREVGS
jgi:hypothetical protein